MFWGCLLFQWRSIRSYIRLISPTGHRGSVGVRLSPSRALRRDCDRLEVISTTLQMTTEIRNWAIIAQAMEAQGATESQMYVRAKALANGEPDPMPTSFPPAPFTISEVLL